MKRTTYIVLGGWCKERYRVMTDAWRRTGTDREGWRWKEVRMIQMEN